MGYTTWFTGHLKFNKPLAPHHLTYLQAFNEMPHVYWDVELIKDVPDPTREAVGLPLGENGCYFTGDGFRSEYSFTGYVYRGAPDPGYRGPLAPGKPTRRCDWRPSDDGTELEVCVDKTYGYMEWLQYLLDHFIIPWGYELNGSLDWHGEFEEDKGRIVAAKNILTVLDFNTNSDTNLDTKDDL